MDAKQTARNDWQHKKARYLVIGTLPHLQVNRGEGFYVASVGSEDTAEGRAFCAEYNSELMRLVDEFGIPDWAPGARTPSREECLRIATNLHESPPSELSSEALRFLNLARARREAEHVVIRGYALEPRNHILLMCGNRGSRCGAIDVIDILYMELMATYEFRRRHVDLPW